MKTLFEITEELELLENHLLENPDEDNTAIIEYLEQAQGQLSAKLEAYAEMITMVENRIAVRQQKIRGLQGLVKSDQAMVNKLKKTLTWFFNSRQVKEVRTESYKIALAKNGGKLPLIIHDAALLIAPEKFITYKADFNNDAIREALDRGEVLNFAYYGDRGESIRLNQFQSQDEE